MPELRYGPPRLVAGVAYNMYYGLLRFRKEHADLDMFCRVSGPVLCSRSLIRIVLAEKKANLPWHFKEIRQPHRPSILEKEPFLLRNSCNGYRGSTLKFSLIDPCTRLLGFLAASRL